MAGFDLIRSVEAQQSSADPNSRVSGTRYPSRHSQSALSADESRQWELTDTSSPTGTSAPSPPFCLVHERSDGSNL